MQHQRRPDEILKSGELSPLLGRKLSTLRCLFSSRTDQSLSAISSVFGGRCWNWLSALLTSTSLKTHSITLGALVLPVSLARNVLFEEWDSGDLTNSSSDPMTVTRQESMAEHVPWYHGTSKLSHGGRHDSTLLLCSQIYFCIL